MKLICRMGKYKGQELEIDEGIYRIGRASANNLQILNPYISKFHAEITARPDGKTGIKDLNSTNGTFIGNNRIAKEVLLKNGDIITFGKNETYEVILDLQQQNELTELSNRPRKRPPTKRVVKPAPRSVPEMPITSPAAKPASAGESDSWFNLMDFSSDFGRKIDFKDESIETGSFADSDIDWPDVVKLKIAHDLYEKLLAGCKILLQCYDEYRIFEKAALFLEPILAFNNGIIAFRRNTTIEKSFDYFYLNDKDLELSEAADEIHHEYKHEPKTQILPYKNRFNSVLYKSLKSDSHIFGFAFLLCDLLHAGFTQNDALAFDQICEVFEAALGKFLIK